MRMQKVNLNVMTVHIHWTGMTDRKITELNNIETNSAQNSMIIL